MVCRATGLVADSQAAQALWSEMLDSYSQETSIHPRLFPGMDQVLDQLQEQSIPWGIVTNKPGYYTHKLLVELDLQ